MTGQCGLVKLTSQNSGEVESRRLLTWTLGVGGRPLLIGF